MPATPMYVELLVIGLSASIWLGLFLSWLFGGGWMTTSLPGTQYFSLLISALAVSVAYALGILVDKLSKNVLEKIVGEEKNYFEKYAALLRSGNKLAIEDLTYVRSKVRILRASVINFPLMAILPGRIPVESHAGHGKLDSTAVVHFNSRAGCRGCAGDILVPDVPL